MRSSRTKLLPGLTYGIIMVVFLVGCKSFPPELLHAEKSELDGKLVRLEIGKLESERVVSDIERKIAVQYDLYTIFQRELENNIFAVGQYKHGTIVLRVTRLDQRLGNWWVLTGITFFLSPVFGLPMYKTTSGIAISILIYNRDGNIIKTYSYHRDGTKKWRYYTPGGIYFTEIKGLREHTILQFKDIMRQFREDIEKDIEELNHALTQQ